MTIESRPPLIVLGGPTASGKTALAIDLAEALGNAEIISADSRQVYRGMDIGTAKATAAERGRVPHHGLDLVDPDAAFTVAEFQRHAHEALDGIRARGNVAILAGGTGLYLRAVARGLPLAGSPPDPALRARLQDRLDREGVGALARELVARAPDVAGSVDLRNPRRVIRALERVAATGDRRPPAPRGYAGRSLWLGLDAPRESHRRLIAERAAGQFSGGLIEEAAALAARYRPDLPAFSAFGYREAFDLLAGRSDLATALERTVARTTAYARRQRTWFRSEPGIEWVQPGAGGAAEALALARRFLRG